MSDAITAGRDTQQTYRRVKYVRSIEQVQGLAPEERERLKAVTDRYCFRANDYYLDLIDWDDPHDPIRQLILPRSEELDDSGCLDPSNEGAYTVTRGVQHKYPDTVLMLCNDVCGSFCRYCFRKRLFMDDNDEVASDVPGAIRYVADHPEVTDVLLSGGDPLLMSTQRLGEIIEALRAIPHVRVIRIGSKLPAFDPWRILRDSALQDILKAHSTPQKRIYLMAHFDHPRELTPPAIEAVDCLIRCGVICVNQCPLIKGVNDDPDVLADLYRQLAAIGCPAYYLFQCRPAAGNAPYKVPIVRGWEIVQQALRRGSGLAHRARYVMSHATGKVEIVAVDDRYVYLRYHRARSPADHGRLVIANRDDNACWLDELKSVEPGAAGGSPSSTTRRASSR